MQMLSNGMRLTFVETPVVLTFISDTSLYAIRTLGVLFHALQILLFGTTYILETF